MTERKSIARQAISDAGELARYVPAEPEGHQFENDGRLILHIRYDPPALEPGKGSGFLAGILGLGESGEAPEAEPLTVTIRTGFHHDGLKLADREIVLAPGESVFVGPLDPQIYNQPGTRQVHVDYSATEGVHVAVLQLPR